MADDNRHTTTASRQDSKSPQKAQLQLNDIKAEAQRLGFFACGAARAEAVDAKTAATVRSWLDKGSQADMAYMANYTEKRLDPRLLVPGVKTILSLAMNYAPAHPMPDGEYQLAAYAYGQDYHEVMKDRLRELAGSLIPHPLETGEPATEGEIRIFVDTAPVLERYWAWKAGIGWIGKNHQLIIPRAGSMFFLGEIFLPLNSMPTTSRWRTTAAAATGASTPVPPMPSPRKLALMPPDACPTNSSRTVANCRTRHEATWAIPSTVATAVSRLVRGIALQCPTRSQLCSPNLNYSE